MIKVRCGVYRLGTVFTVEIDLGDEVEELQKAIVNEKKPVNDHFKVDPSAVTLYLARGTDGKWLKHAGAQQQLLEGVINPEYKEMLSSMLVGKHYLGRKFKPNPGEIHVLVKLPEPTAASASAEGPSTQQMIKDIYQHIVRKRERYVHSEMNSSAGKELLQELNIKVEIVEAIPFDARDAIPVPAFTWESVLDESGASVALTEDQQRKRYREYVEHHLRDVLTEKKLCVPGVEYGKNLLSVKVPGRDVQFSGRTDMLILSAHAQKVKNYAQLLPQAKMLIEVKRVVGGHLFQALSELIALDLLVDEPVMALLTNLTDSWQFFWVSGKSDSAFVIQTTTITDPGAAFAVTKALLDQSRPGDVDITLPCLEKPVKRRKLAAMLPAISEGGDTSGIRAVIERYYDVASMLGPDVDMACAAATQIARTIPVFSYYS